jgi:hypothetical protein
MSQLSTFSNGRGMATAFASWFIIILLSIKTAHCFSVRGFDGIDIASIASLAGDDATSLSPLLLDTIASRQSEIDGEGKGEIDGDCILGCQISLSSELHQVLEPISVQRYNEFTSRRHSDCIDLFDRYESTILRCELLSSTRTSKTQVAEYNIRWQASWVSAGGVWLFNLADSVGWKIQERVPDSTQVSTFSWQSVGQVFQNAFKTGTICLPVNIIQGNTYLKILKEDDSSKVLISTSEFIDLVKEADLGRLQNRKVAQELASWLDVSRRPIDMDGKEVQWAASVRERILKGVPGAGPLDVDPNEDGPWTFLSFGFLIIIAFSLLTNSLFDEVVGNTKKLSDLCDDAVKIEMGSGYFSECLGAYGDGRFL